MELKASGDTSARAATTAAPREFIGKNRDPSQKYRRNWRLRAVLVAAIVAALPRAVAVNALVACVRFIRAMMVCEYMTATAEWSDGFHGDGDRREITKTSRAMMSLAAQALVETSSERTKTVACAILASLFDESVWEITTNHGVITWPARWMERGLRIVTGELAVVRRGGGGGRAAQTVETFRTQTSQPWESIRDVLRCHDTRHLPVLEHIADWPVPPGKRINAAVVRRIAEAFVEPRRSRRETAVAAGGAQ